MRSKAVFIGLVWYVSGLNGAVVDEQPRLMARKELSSLTKYPVTVSGEEKTEKNPDCCPKGMANIENLFCIDRYEASIVDKNTGAEASPHYIPSREGVRNADWQYEFFKRKDILPMKVRQLVKDGQPVSLPARGTEQFLNFEPAAVSSPDKIPATYVTKNIAGLACKNAEKRLCARKEWYAACVGSSGPRPYFDEDGEEIFPEAYPYGPGYQKGKCNLGFLEGIWPPHLLGRKNDLEMLDPRISALLGKDRHPMKRETGAFPGCANRYGVYDLVGNVHEIVADAHLVKHFPEERVVFVGSHYARNANQSCAEATKDHWPPYTDYSIGFRCCKDAD